MGPDFQERAKSRDYRDQVNNLQHCEPLVLESANSRMECDGIQAFFCSLCHDLTGQRVRPAIGDFHHRYVARLCVRIGHMHGM